VRLALVGGNPGTGKSTVARALAEQTGAQVISTDDVRRELRDSGAIAGDAGVTIEFGGTNPLGLERYARIAGRSEILLMPAFVADAWQMVAEAR